MKRYYFTSESVTDGHPDKICDQIADAILDEALRINPQAKMAVEATIKDELVFIYGEQNLGQGFEHVLMPYELIARRVLDDIGLDASQYTVLIKVGAQSPEIHDKVVQAEEIAAGDQGIMFGYATHETPNFMPLAIDTAHQLAKRLSQYKQENARILPDGKTQVTVLYENDRPIKISTVVVSTQHTRDYNLSELRNDIQKHVIDRVIDPKWVDEDTQYIINPGGLFVIGGSYGDSGTTGRKIVVDSYGGMGRIGGGCFSSKDPSKVDRSAAYYARYVAKNLVAAGLMDRCEVQVSYAIGMSQPLSIYINSFDTEKVATEEIDRIVHLNFDFSVSNIIQELQLLQPIYRNSANFGHFGREGFSWERIINLKK
jgi:S-adenosylmethionine synthetase